MPSELIKNTYVFDESDVHHEKHDESRISRESVSEILDKLDNSEPIRQTV
jgi:hypothetical protein